MRRILALVMAAWTAALPAHVPVRICFCVHDAEKPCRHGAEEHECVHGRHEALPEDAIDGTAPAPERRCVEVTSPHDLVRVGVSENVGPREKIVGGFAAPVRIEATAETVRPAFPRVLGPPIFLRVLALLV